MSLFNETIWGNVSLDTVKSTRAWKTFQGSDGKVEHKIFNKVLKAALIELGYDDGAGVNYKKLKHMNIRSEYSNELIFQTIIYSFPVKSNYRFKSVYEKMDVVHINEDTSKHINFNSLYEFGLEEYTTVGNKNNNDEYYCEV